MEEGFTKVCKVSELKENQGKRFLINDVDIAVFKVNEEVFVVK